MIYNLEWSNQKALTKFCAHVESTGHCCAPSCMRRAQLDCSGRLGPTGQGSCACDGRRQGPARRPEAGARGGGGGRPIGLWLADRPIGYQGENDALCRPLGSDCPSCHQCGYVGANVANLISCSRADNSLSAV